MQWDDGDAAARGPGSVVVENARDDVRRSQQEGLERAGFEVTACAGPGHGTGQRGCDIITNGDCALIDAADVVVYDLDLDDVVDREVLRAVRATRPTLPIVLELPVAAARRHRDVLEGCTVIPPYSPARLQEVVRAMASPVTGVSGT